MQISSLRARIGCGGGLILKGRRGVLPSRPLRSVVVRSAGQGGARPAPASPAKKARRAGKQAANAQAVNKRLKADDSYFWKLKADGFAREKPDQPSAAELFGDTATATVASSPLTDQDDTTPRRPEIEAQTEVTRDGKAGRDVPPLDEFRDDAFRTLMPTFVFDNLVGADRMAYRRPSPVQVRALRRKP